MEKLLEVGRHWHDQFASSLMFALVGIVIGMGQLLAGTNAQSWDCNHAKIV